MNPAGLPEVEAHIASLLEALRAQTQSLAEARSELTRAERQWRIQAEAGVATAADEAAKGLVRDRKAIDANADEATSSALAVVGRMLEGHAPGFLSADWSDTAWVSMAPAAAGAWARVGSVRLGTSETPVALPLSAGVWSVVGADAAAFRALVHNTIARVVAAFDPPRVRVVSYDPDLTLDLAAFAGLREVSQSSVPPALTSEEDLERALDQLRTEVSLVDDRLTAAGQDTFWSAVAADHPLSLTTPLRILVLGAGSVPLSDRGLARLDQLRRLAADRGLLIIESAKAAPPAGTPGAVVTLAGPTAAASVVPGIEWTPDEWPGDRFIRTLSSLLVDRPRQSLAPTVKFEDIVEAIEDVWLADADEGLESVVGVIDGGDLVIRLRSENPPMPNALVGGAVGQGKSNLLLVMIHSLAAKYSPAELQMVLIDLRDGVEFSRLGPSAASPTWLPHVRALGLEFDPDYSLSVLRWVRAQMVERSNLLKATGSSTLKQYHQNTGKVIPRLLVVIDEFQRLFEGDDDQAATAAKDLDDIARTGRGFGIHIVLASQAITGIRGLATKVDSVLGQFHNRITLRNTPAESQAFLQAHNVAAAELEHRGQVVFNDALGAVSGNKLGTVAYADPTYLERLQVQLFQQGHGAPPSIFRASAFADWPAGSLGATAPDGVSAAVGVPIELEARPRVVRLSRSPNQGIAVVGSNRATCIPVLVSAVSTAVESLGTAPRITLLDGDSEDGSSPKPWIAALLSRIEGAGAVVERVSRSAVAARLVELGGETDTTDLVVAVALDSVDLGTPVGPDYIQPDGSLRELLRSGSVHGTWLIGWWQSKSVLEEHVGYRAPGIRAWAFSGVSRDDLTDVAGHAVREPATSPRVIWFDRTAGTAAERLVPLDPRHVIGEVDHG